MRSKIFWRPVALVALLFVGVLGLTKCGDSSGIGKYVADDCSTTPAKVVAARKSLRNTGMSKCVDATNCDDAFVLSQLAGAAGCDAVTLTGGPIPQSGVVADSETKIALFFEASASMNAYLAQQKGLKDHLLDIIQRLQQPGNAVADSLQLFYISEQMAAYSGQSMDFVSTLVPGKMPKVGPSTSDIADLVKAAFAKTGANEAVILVSDFVFSPGKGVNAQQYLSQQKIVIRNLVQQQVQLNPKFSVALISAESDFKGNYYDRNNNVHKYAGKRPYYYLVAGPRQLVLEATQRAGAATGGTVQYYSPSTLAVPISFEQHLRNRSQGSFSVSDNDPTPTLENAKSAIGGPNNGYLLLNIKADMSGLEDAQAAVERAQLSNGFELVQVVALRPDEKPYTHLLTLRRQGTQYPGIVKMTLPRASAEDLSARYLTDDAADPSSFDGQTFGLQQLVEGIEGAYAPDAQKPAATISFTIQ